jgi:anti-anti-sigma regulatory factor
MTSPFTVEVAFPTRLVLAGEFDHAGVSEFEASFRGLQAVVGGAHVVIDVRALEFCDSAGWHSLERCCDDGAKLVGTPACLRRLFYLIRNANRLPAGLHELRGLEPGAARRLAA